MKRWAWLTLFLVILVGICLLTFSFMAISIIGYPPPIQDWLDRGAMQRHFGLPRGFDLVVYDGYPPVVGFMQREGLQISAVYQLSETQAARFTLDAQNKGWETLPLPSQTFAKTQHLREVVPLLTQTGIYICKTAGNDVLHARHTRPCDSIGYLSDVILGIFDGQTNKLYLVISSGY
jgi:hypothetical protein